MNTEFKPAEAEPTLFQPPPDPAEPVQCQNAPEFESTAHASVGSSSKTDESFVAAGPDNPFAIENQETPLQ
jgi:hypothetical protein